MEELEREGLEEVAGRGGVGGQGGDGGGHT